MARVAPALPLLLALLVGPTALTAADSSAWVAKVDPWVIQQAATAGSTEMLLVLDEQADLAQAAAFTTKRDRGRQVVAALRAVADRTQKPVLAALAQRGLPARPYWIVNMIWTQGDSASVRALAELPAVLRIAANPAVAAALPQLETPVTAHTPAAIEASLTHVGAPTLWGGGINGTGVVIAGADTGYRWDHNALKAKYRGWDGTVADHNFHWWDAIHTSTGSCGANSAVPCDDNNHGTHTMGTMLGDDGGANQIGMAPGARWIGCRNMNAGVGTPTTYAECFQFFLAPTDLAGANANPDLAPDVINNSWGCPPSEGCTDRTVLQGTVDAVRAAGIVVVASAGNAGSGCNTVADPPAIYDASFTVAATDNNDNVASFSSRGPVTSDSSGRMKPDIAGPGVSIRSATRTGTASYGSLSGTSMSGPHVAGLVALLISAAPCLRGDVDGVETYIINTAVPRTSAQTCGGILGSEVPNPIYGYGAIRAIQPAADFCTTIFSDGFESGNTSLWELGAGL